ncbi:MAG: DUF378 domain-containing protein [Patescibacteria group bacterium]
MKALHTTTFLLLVIGGLNWLLVGALGWDVSKFLGGPEALVSRVIYILVGVAAIVEVATHKSACKACDKGGTKSMNMG